MFELYNERFLKILSCMSLKGITVASAHAPSLFRFFVLIIDVHYYMKYLPYEYNDIIRV